MLECKLKSFDNLFKVFIRQNKSSEILFQSFYLYVEFNSILIMLEHRPSSHNVK